MSTDPGAAVGRPSSFEHGRLALRMLDPDDYDIDGILCPSLPRCPFCGRRPVTTCGINDQTLIYVAKIVCSQVECGATVIATSRDQADARATVAKRWGRRALAAETRGGWD